MSEGRDSPHAHASGSDECSVKSARGNSTGSSCSALRATASVNSMYATPVAKSVKRTGVPVMIDSTNSSSTRQPPAFSGGIGISVNSSARPAFAPCRRLAPRMRSLCRS